MNKNHKYVDRIPSILSRIKTEPSESVRTRLQSGMRNHARYLQESYREPEFFLLSVEWWHTFPGKIAFVMGSFLFLASVFVAYAAQPSNALSDTIDALRLAAETQRSIQSVTRMRCEIRRDSDASRPAHSIVQWSAPDDTAVDLYQAESSQFIRVMEKKNGIVIQEAASQNLGNPDRRSEISSVLERFSSPGHIARRLRGIWKIVKDDGQPNDAIRIWIQIPGQLGSCAVWLDRDSTLPSRMETYIDRTSEGDDIFMDYWYLKFDWNGWGE